MFIHKLSVKSIKIENGFNLFQNNDEENTNTYMRILNMLHSNKEMYSDIAKQVLGGEVEATIPLKITCRVNHGNKCFTEEELISNWREIECDSFGISDVNMTITYSLKEV